MGPYARRVDTSQPNPPIGYPVKLQNRGAAGSVVMRVHVNAGGHPLGLELIQSSGDKDLDLVAEGGVLGWHYLPAVRDGDTVTGWAIVRVAFQKPAVPAAARSSH